MNDREMRVVKEDKLYELLFAQELIDAGKLPFYRNYIGMMSEKEKNGMNADEVDAVKERVKAAASKHTN